MALAAPAAVRAEAPDASRSALLGSGIGSVSGWWGAPGRPGWLPDGETGSGHLWTLAGLVAGAWSIDPAGRDAPGFPMPGIPGAQEPLAWFDTLTVTAGEGGAWDGFDGALARVNAGPGLARPERDRRPRSDLLLVSGSDRIADHALTLWRGDSLGGWRVETASGSRVPAGALFSAERDIYHVAVAKGLGHNAVEAAFAHRRTMASLAGGESQQVRGESGHAGYRYQGPRWRVDAGLRRAYAWHESFGVFVPDGLRLAHRTGARVDVERQGAGGSVAVRWDFTESEVVSTPAAAGPERGRAQWGAARWRGPFAGGRLEATLGVGRHDAITGTTLAPALAWTFADAPLRGRLVGERLLTPIWSDLAAGETPFLQDAWAGGMEVGLGPAHGARITMSLLAGRVRHRAVMERLPLESFALRSGFRADPELYHFGLAVAEGSWSSRRLTLGVEGFALSRDAGSIQPLVDPARGGRVFAEARIHLFGGDLGIRPRAEAWLIGPRESEALPSNVLAGYATAVAAIELTLSDATLTVEARNLEDRPRPQTWVDGATGVEALGPGREIRATFVWRLWD